MECCTQLKTNALKQVIEQKGLDAVFLGIRRDEHGIRAKERVFSLRDEEFEWNYKAQSPEFWSQYKTRAGSKEHLRVHPILGWTELDIWSYIEKEKFHLWTYILPGIIKDTGVLDVKPAAIQLFLQQILWKRLFVNCRTPIYRRGVEGLRIKNPII